MSDKHQIAIAFLVFAVLLITGCLSPLSPSGNSKNSTPPIGMGLELSESFPPPGPFLEDRQDLKTLEDFLLLEGEELLLECGDLESYHKMKRELDLEMHWPAFRTLTFGCSPEAEVERLAEEAMREGTEKEKRDELLPQTVSALEEFRNLILAHPGPGNEVEAQLLYYLANQYRSQIQDGRSFTERLWSAYEEGIDRSKRQLNSIFMGYMSPIQRSEQMEQIFERFPWSENLCHPPDIDLLVERIDALVPQAQEKAAIYGHDKVHAERNDVTTIENGQQKTYEGRTLYENGQYNQLMNSVLPRFEWAQENNWWPMLLAVEGSIESRIAYWDAFELPAWPNQEESAYLMAERRHESRTIWQESTLAVYRERLEFEETIPYFGDWESDTVSGPPRLLSRLSEPWPFENLECSNTP